MSSVLAEIGCPMAKDKEQTKRNDVPVRIDAEVLEDVRIAAAYAGISIAEYLSEKMRPIAAQDVEEGHKKRALKFPPKRPR